MAVERAAARYVAGLALGILAVSLAWFAYIDAPISDRVMLWIACAVAAGVIAALAGLWDFALTLRASVGETIAVPRRVLRLRWLSMLALAVLVVIMAMAMVATLNLKGAASGSETEDTAVAV